MADGDTGTGLLSGSGTPTEVADDHFTKAEDFPEALAGKMSRFTDPSALATGYSELESKLGTAIIPPAENATDEQKAEHMAKLHKLMGRPDSVDGYDIKKPDDLPEGLQWDDDMVAQVKQLAFKHGWNPAATQDLVQMHTAWQSKLLKAGTDALDTAANEAESQLKESLGEAKYAVAIQAAEKAFHEVIEVKHPELAKLVMAYGLHNNAHFIKYMIDVYDLKLGEGTIVPGEGDAGAKRRFLDYSKVDK